jgi:hypothetical protein
MVDLNRVEGTNEEINEAIKDQYDYHPWNEDQKMEGELVRRALVEAVRIIIEVVPPSPDRSSALRKLREARMDCNSAITHHGKY